MLSKNFRIYLTAPLRVEMLSNAHLKVLPSLQLDIPPALQQKFDKIYSKYTEDFWGEDYRIFLKYLNENNQWEKAKLTHQNETYDVLIKLHGKSPTQHVEGNHYSLGVKVLNNKKINGVSRFNLIVYWRIRYNYDVIEYLAKSMEIYQKTSDLTSVQINDRQPKLYYFEYRINQEYFDKIAQPNLIALKHKSDHSVIFTGGNIVEWNEKLRTAIAKIELDDSLKKIIYEKYATLNKAIYEQDEKTVLSFFDLDYLAKIQAFRYLYADNGHGFGVDNFLAAFNTDNSKFYPFVHRDNSAYTLDISAIKDRFDGKNIGTEYEKPLFDIFANSDILAKKTKAYLVEILEKKQVTAHAIDSIVAQHNSYYYSSFIKQKMGKQELHSATANIKNISETLLYSKNSK